MLNKTLMQLNIFLKITTGDKSNFRRQIAFQFYLQFKQLAPNVFEYDGPPPLPS